MKLIRTFESGTPANITMQGGELAVIVGRPATGKTTLAHDIMQASVGEGKNGLYCGFDKPTFQYYAGNGSEVEAVQPCTLPDLFKDIKSSKGLDIVVIDYLQALQHFDFGSADGGVISAFKALADDLGIAVILVSAFGRGKGNPTPENTVAGLTCVDKLFLLQRADEDGCKQKATINYYEK